MKKTPLVLIDDPQANGLYDLAAALAAWPHGLAALIRVAAEAAAPVVGGSAEKTSPTATAAQEAAPEKPANEKVEKDADRGGEDSQATTLLKTRPVRYRIAGKGVSEREFAASEGSHVLESLGKSPLVVVAFVSYSTFPLLASLAQDDSTRDFLKVGVTGVRLDTHYNLAQKLHADGMISYHEHSRAVEKVLCSRLELMLNAHQERLWQMRKSS